MNKQSVLYTVFFTFIVCFVFVAVLALANEATAERVAQNQVIAQQRAVLTAMGIDFASDDDVIEQFNEVEQEEIDGRIFYRVERDGEVIYATEFRGQGVWGPIVGVLSMDESLERTMGLEIIDHEETPGLGGRITEGWFREQFQGRSVPDGTFSYVRDSSPGDGEFEAITGATGTTSNMERILTETIEIFKDKLGGRTA